VDYAPCVTGTSLFAFCAGRVLSGTLTLGQLRRGSGAAPASTPFSFMPLPPAPKKEDSKPASSTKAKPAEQRVSAFLLVLMWWNYHFQYGCCSCFHYIQLSHICDVPPVLLLSEALCDAKLDLLKGLKADSLEDAALTQNTLCTCAAVPMPVLDCVSCSCLAWW
jgi:hypothetical protein